MTKTLEQFDYICPICRRDLIEDQEDWAKKYECCTGCVANGEASLNN